MTCPHCGGHVTRCPRRSALCRWLCGGWEHATGTHYCGSLDVALAAGPPDISDIGPGPEWYRELWDEVA